MKSERRLQPTADLVGDGKFVSWHQYDALKGILILLIVMGHNTSLQKLMPGMQSLLYNFHVAAFLLLPMLMPADDFSVRRLRDKAVRLLVPHIVFITLATLGYATVITGSDAAETLAMWLKALVLANNASINAATGFQLYWFLPTLFALIVLRAWHYSMTGRGAALAAAFLVAFVLLYNTTGFSAEYSVPWGLDTAAYALLTGLLCIYATRFLARLQRAYNATAPTFGFLLVALVALSWISANVTGSSLNLARGDFFSIAEPGRFMLHILLVFAGLFTSMFAAFYLHKVRLLRFLGRYSLVIFLSHSLIYYSLNLFALQAGLQIFTPPGAMISLAATLALASLLAAAIDRTKGLRRFITPRGFGDLSKSN